MKYKVISGEVEELAKKYFWLAYEACTSPFGMGILQARDSVTEDQVFENVKTRGDYPGGAMGRADGEYYGDYVFGKMMKTGLRIQGQVVEINGAEPRFDYQSWCRSYPTQDALLAAAAKEADVELEAV
jgi:hypothetical protein